MESCTGSMSVVPPSSSSSPANDDAGSRTSTNDEQQRRTTRRRVAYDLKIRAMVHRANLSGMLLTARRAAIEASSSSSSSIATDASHPPPQLGGYERGLERTDAISALSALWDVESHRLEPMDNRIPLIVDDDDDLVRRRRMRLNDASREIEATASGRHDTTNIMEARVDDFFISYPECRRRDDTLLYGETGDDDESSDNDDDDDDSEKKEKQKARGAGSRRSKEYTSIVEITCSSSSSPSPERSGTMKSADESNDGGRVRDAVNNIDLSADDVRNRKLPPTDDTSDRSRNRGGRHPRDGVTNASNVNAAVQSHRSQAGLPSSNDRPGNPYNAGASDQSRNWNSNDNNSSRGQHVRPCRPSSNDDPENHSYQMQPPRGESIHSSKSHYQHHSRNERPPTNDRNIENPYQRHAQEVRQPTGWQGDRDNLNSYQNRSSAFDYDDNNSYGRSEPPVKKNPFVTAKELVPSCDDNSRSDNHGGGGRCGREEDAWDNYGSKGGGANNRSASSTGPCGPQQLVRAAIRGPKDNMSAGLKRKFQPPMKRDGGGGGNGNINCGQNSSNGVHKSCNSSTRHASGGGGTGGNANNEDDELPEELRGLDKELIEKINNEIVDTGEQVTFDDIAGLKHAKDTVNEMVIMPMMRPDLFTGLRSCPKGLLLFGPPGTGTVTTFIPCIRHLRRSP